MILIRFSIIADILLFIYLQKLFKEVKFGDVKIHASKIAIEFSTESTFLVLKPKKNGWILSFYWTEEITEPLIYKSTAVWF